MTVLVPTAEVAAVLGKRATATDVEAEAIELGMLVQQDWAGRASLSAADAKSLLDGSARQTREHERRWAAHLKREANWQKAQLRAANAAAEKVRAEQRASGRYIDGEAWGQQNAAARKAYIEFEKAEPKPEWSPT